MQFSKAMKNYIIIGWDRISEAITAELRSEGNHVKLFDSRRKKETTFVPLTMPEDIVYLDSHSLLNLEQHLPQDGQTLVLVMLYQNLLLGFSAVNIFQKHNVGPIKVCVMDAKQEMLLEPMTSAEVIRLDKFLAERVTAQLHVKS